MEMQTMKSNRILPLLLGASLATCTGCMRVSEQAEAVTRYVITGHTEGAYTPRKADKYDLENYYNFILLDRGTERSVTCSAINQRFRDDGRLEVIANVRNRQERRIQVEASCVFKDEQGFPTNDEAPFRTVILSENAQEGVRFVSFNDKARTYTIRIRQAH